MSTSSTGQNADPPPRSSSSSSPGDGSHILDPGLLDSLRPPPRRRLSNDGEQLLSPAEQAQLLAEVANQSSSLNVDSLSPRPPDRSEEDEDDQTKPNLLVAGLRGVPVQSDDEEEERPRRKRAMLRRSKEVPARPSRGGRPSAGGGRRAGSGAADGTSATGRTSDHATFSAMSPRTTLQQAMSPHLQKEPITAEQLMERIEELRQLHVGETAVEGSGQRPVVAEVDEGYYASQGPEVAVDSVEAPEQYTSGGRKFSARPEKMSSTCTRVSTFQHTWQLQFCFQFQWDFRFRGAPEVVRSGAPRNRKSHWCSLRSDVRTAWLLDKGPILFSPQIFWCFVLPSERANFELRTTERRFRGHASFAARERCARRERGGVVLLGELWAVRRHGRFPHVVLLAARLSFLPPSGPPGHHVAQHGLLGKRPPCRQKFGERRRRSVGDEQCWDHERRPDEQRVDGRRPGGVHRFARGRRPLRRSAGGRRRRLRRGWGLVHKTRRERGSHRGSA